MPTTAATMIPRDFETYAEAKDRRAKKIRLLAQGNQHRQRLAAKLRQCRKANRCNSGACDICVGNFRLKLYRQTRSIFDSRPHWTRASVIPSGLLIQYAGLPKVDLIAIGKLIDKRLERSSLKKRLVMAGIDISLNLQDNDIIGWQLHLYLLIEGEDTLQLREAVKAAFPSEPTAPKPHEFRPVTNFAKAITYLFKSTFKRRSRYTNAKGQASTRDQPLKGPDLMQLLPFLDRHPICARLILRGIRRNGGTFSLVKRR
jgi:hypothetical protein